MNKSLSLIFFGILFSFVLPLSSHGQYDTLLLKDYLLKAPLLWRIGDSVYFQDSAKAFAITKRLREFGKAHNDISIVLEADLQEAFRYQSQKEADPEKIVSQLSNLIQQGKDHKILRIEACARSILGNYYWVKVKYGKAFDEFSVLETLLKNVPDKDFPDKVRMVYFMANAFLSFQDYRHAINLYKTIPAPFVKTTFATEAYFVSLRDIAIAYQKMGKLDSSTFYYAILEKETKKNGDRLWIGIAQSG